MVIEVSLGAGEGHAEELYAVKDDPYQLENLAADEQFADIKNQLADMLQDYLATTGDPRALGKEPGWDAFPYACGLRIRRGPGGSRLEGSPL